ncbi:hypothetical protein BJX62DRAFT_206030 [Aspergillus germanicus]
MDSPPRSNQPRKTRSACDKCHTQKLRCTRKPGQSQCERCLRLNDECRFAPRAKRGSKKPRSHSDSTRRKQSTSNQISAPGTEIDLDIGDHLEGSLPTESWLDSLGLADPVDNINWDIEPAVSAWDVNLDTAWVVTGPDMGGTQNGCTMQMALNPMSCPNTTSTHELANLSIALYELMAKFPSIRDDACTTSDMTAQSTRQALPFMFDELFSLTTRFTNLIKHCLCGIQGTDQDEPTALMVGACHSRLTAIYTAIFSMMRRCLQHTGGPPRPRPDGSIILPTVQLGSLSSPSLYVDFENPLSIGKAFMYMWMVAVFSGQLWGQLADVMRERHVAAGRSLVYTLWKEMGERVDGLLETIDTTKGLLR